jgi:methylamine dehydrogenase accessory protein MauD
MLIASTFLLWIVVAVLAIAVLALARQVGVLHERIAPMGALVTDAGPRAGDMAPHVHATTLDGEALAIGPGHMGQRNTLLMFVAPNCPVCKKIVPLAKGVASAENLDLVFVGDGEDGEIRSMVDRYKLNGFAFANSASIGLAFHVGKLPYGVLIRPDGVIAAKGLVSSREHLESLMIADETGFSSAQAYLKSLNGKVAA